MQSARGRWCCSRRGDEPGPRRFGLEVIIVVKDARRLLLTFAVTHGPSFSDWNK
jgi:hypothetical protein